jgi:hypothetical protein
VERQGVWESLELRLKSPRPFITQIPGGGGGDLQLRMFFTESQAESGFIIQIRFYPVSECGVSPNLCFPVLFSVKKTGKAALK